MMPQLVMDLEGETTRKQEPERVSELSGRDDTAREKHTRPLRLKKYFRMWRLVVGLVVLIPIIYVVILRTNETPRRPGETPHPVKPEAVSESLPKTLRDKFGIEFVLIPAGEFPMGSRDKEKDETPVHQVRISSAFYLGKYEVKQAQWQAVMGNNPSRFSNDPNRPVEQVSWEEVQQFIGQLNSREGSNTYRLPTEAEWEYAARAGTTTAYSFGEDVGQLGTYAWYSENSGGTTHPVGQKARNAWGLHDMHGNVWEWMQDWYGAYAADAVRDPQGPASGLYRVIRGGSWGYDARYCRSASRFDAAPGNRYGTLGFRLLRTAPLRLGGNNFFWGRAYDARAGDHLAFRACYRPFR